MDGYNIADFLCQLKSYSEQIISSLDIGLNLNTTCEQDIGGDEDLPPNGEGLKLQEDINTHFIWQCDLCKKSFQEEHYLLEHKKYVHSSLQPFQCTLCSAKYKRKSDLSVHISKKHATIKITVKCEVCDHTFSCKSALNRHKSEKHSPSPILYSCQKCDKRFYRKHDLMRHSNKCSY